MYMVKAGCTILHPTLNISVGLQMKRIEAGDNSKQHGFYYQQNHQTTQVTAIIRTHVISLSILLLIQLLYCHLAAMCRITMYHRTESSISVKNISSVSNTFLCNQNYCLKAATTVTQEDINITIIIIWQNN